MGSGGSGWGGVGVLVRLGGGFRGFLRLRACFAGSVGGAGRGWCWFRGAVVVWVGGRVYCDSQGQLRQSRARARSRAEGRLRRRLRGERPRSGEWGPRSRAADAACGRLRPGFPAASSPGGNHPGLGGVKPDHCCWPPVSSGWTPPSPGWLCKHRRSDGESGTTPVCGVDGVHPVRHSGGQAVCARGAGTLPTGGVVPDSPSLRRAKPSRPGRWCQVADTRPPAGRSDLIPPDRSASVRRRCDGESGTEATTSSVRRLAARPPTPRSEAARRAGAAGGACSP
ncbi:hypothetical protein ABIA35_004571 [Catenulispora sp. MAP12-49]